MGQRIGMIWAQARDGVIGVNNTIPWHLKEDFAHFRRTTLGSPVIMGRATWDSLPERVRPLPGRTNIVVSRSVNELPGAVVGRSLDEALSAAGEDSEVWIMGGAQIYALAEPSADVLVVTEIDLAVEGDAFAPEIGADWLLDAPNEWLTSESGLRYKFSTYRRRTR